MAAEEEVQVTASGVTEVVEKAKVYARQIGLSDLCKIEVQLMSLIERSFVEGYEDGVEATIEIFKANYGFEGWKEGG